MSIPVAVFHGPFGRVCLYSMDRTMVPHAHREGHLIFHVEGPPGEVVVDGAAPGRCRRGRRWRSARGRRITTARSTRDADAGAGALYPPGLVSGGRPPRLRVAALRRVGVEVTDHLARLVFITAHAMLDPDHEDPLPRGPALHADPGGVRPVLAMDRARRGLYRPAAAQRDFRIRKALRSLQETRRGSDLDGVAREAGLSRPHFYKLFRARSA
jgi:hypothetical protein